MNAVHQSARDHPPSRCNCMWADQLFQTIVCLPILRAADAFCVRRCKGPCRMITDLTISALNGHDQFSERPLRARCCQSSQFNEALGAGIRYVERKARREAARARQQLEERARVDAPVLTFCGEDHLFAWAFLATRPHRRWPARHCLNSRDLPVRSAPKVERSSMAVREVNSQVQQTRTRRESEDSVRARFDRMSEFPDDADDGRWARLPPRGQRRASRSDRCGMVTIELTLIF